MKEITSRQSIIKTVIEATKAVILTVREAEGHTKSRRAAQAVLRVSRPTLRQPTFNW